MFSQDQLEQLRSFPEISRDELIRYFTLAAGDVAFVDTGRGRGAPDGLGMLVQLCTLPWLGFVPDEVRSAPPAAVGRLADRLGVDPAALSLYGQRAQTRSDHLGIVAEYLGWKTAPAGGEEMKELEQFLLDRAMEHDSPTLLFSLAREYLASAKVIRPGAIVLAKMIGTARKGAGDLTAQLVGHLLTGEVRADLDRMLRVDAGLGMTRLEWLNSPARDASAASVKTAIDKLAWFRGIDAPRMDVSGLPNERRRFLAQVARRSTNQGLERRKERKYPILLAFVAQAAVDQLDEVVALFDQAVSARESRAKSRTEEALAERAKKGEARQLLMDVILPVLADPSVPDELVGGRLRDQIGMQRLREITAGSWKPLPKDHGRLSELDSSYSYLRQFTPNVLAVIDFQGGPGTAELMEAVAVLKEMNRARRPEGPRGRAGRVRASEVRRLPGEGPQERGGHRLPALLGALCVTLCLRDGLRSGDVFVPGSRRYADPSTYLYTARQRAPRQEEYCLPVGKPAAAAHTLEQGKEELHAALAELESVLADSPPGDRGTVRLDGDDHLVVPPLPAEDIPAEARELKDELAGMLPFAPIASLLIELDARTGFLDCFTHAGGRKLPNTTKAITVVAPMPREMPGSGRRPGA